VNRELVKINDEVIADFLNNPKYDIRPDGTIWTCISVNGAGLMPDGKWREIKNLDGKDYIRITLRINGHKKVLKAHRIIYAKYCNALNYMLDINHKNGNRSDNRPSNLELVTSSENNSHKYAELNARTINNAKLNFKVASEIRKLKRETKMTHAKLGEIYGISKGHVSDIVNNKIWNPERKQYSKADLENT
jgi:hypothetical protein